MEEFFTMLWILFWQQSICLSPLLLKNLPSIPPPTNHPLASFDTLWKTSWWKNSISWMKRHTSAPNRYEKEKLILFFLLENLSRDSKCLRDNHRFHLLFRLEKVSGVFLAVTLLGWLGGVCGKKAKWLIAVASQNNSFEGIRKCVWKDFNSWLYLL